jgi:hypothetical protein
VKKAVGSDVRDPEPERMQRSVREDIGLAGRLAFPREPKHRHRAVVFAREARPETDMPKGAFDDRGRRGRRRSIGTRNDGERHDVTLSPSPDRSSTRRRVRA